MYVSTQHQLTDRDAIFSLMEAHPLGTWVVPGDGALDAHHIPFLLDRSQGPCGTLRGHVARANRVWRALRTDCASIVVFQGPQAYITPGWYPSKTAHGRVVPTWNYAVAHAHGVARAVEDRAWLLDLLHRLTDAQEAAQPAPWRVADAPASYIDKLLGAIVGIEISINRLEGKHKLSQDEAMADRRSTSAALHQSPRDEDRAMAALVRQAIDAERSGGR